MPLPIVAIEGTKKCPSCGCEKRATEDYIKALKKGLYLPKDFKEDCLQIQIPFMMAMQSPLNIQQQIPILFINFAVCADCFTIYANNIISAAGQAMPGQPPMGAR